MVWPIIHIRPYWNAGGLLVMLPNKIIQHSQTVLGSPNKVTEVDTAHHHTIEIQCLVVETIGDTPVVTIHTGQEVIIKSVRGLLHQGSPERC